MNVQSEVRKAALWWQWGREKQLEGTMGGVSGVLAMLGSSVWVLVTHT